MPYDFKQIQIFDLFFFPERNNKRKQKFQTVRAADAEGV